MKLENALKLTTGTELIATASFVAPEQVTKGKIYVLQGDARPLWPGRNVLAPISYEKIGPNDQPCNASLPIIDDSGRAVYPTYVWFELVR